MAKRTAAKREKATQDKAKRSSRARSSKARSASANRRPAKNARSRTSKAAAKPSRVSTAIAVARGAATSAMVAVANKLSWAVDENDPIVLLETDHRRFEALLKTGEETTERAVKGRTRLLKTLTAALNVHEAIEERVLYPALKAHPEARDIVLEGFQEHHVADVLVKELHALAKDDEKWGAKFKVLKESLEHHIKEEEQIMFRTARGVLSRPKLRALGTRMKALKVELEN